MGNRELSPMGFCSGIMENLGISAVCAGDSSDESGFTAELPLTQPMAGKSIIHWERDARTFFQESEYPYKILPHYSVWHTAWRQI